MSEQHQCFDKVTVAAYFGDDGRCKQVMVHMNYDGITADDIAAAVKSAFLPGDTFSNRTLGDTGVFRTVVPRDQPRDPEWFSP